jgi:hypothetical protein
MIQWGNAMKVHVFGLIAILFMLTASCQTAQVYTQLQENICSEKFISCPQNRNYSVTYDSCCSFPITYKTREKKKIVVISQEKKRTPSFSLREE